MTSHQQSGQSGAMVRLSMYAAIVLSPLILVALVHPPTHHSFTYTVGTNLALVAFTILAMQFVLSARLKWIERPFGLNVLFQFHKAMAILASLLLISHPFLLALGFFHSWSAGGDLQLAWMRALWAVLLILIVPSVLLVAYFRNYSPGAGGHVHSEMGKGGGAAMGKDGNSSAANLSTHPPNK